MQKNSNSISTPSQRGWKAGQTSSIEFRLRFSFLLRAWFSICFLIFTNLFYALGFGQTQATKSMRCGCGCGCGSPVGKSLRPHWSINTSPVSSWFASDLFANANLLFMFSYFYLLYIRTTKFRQQLANGWGSRPTPCSGRCERVFFYSTTQPPSHTWPIFPHFSAALSFACLLASRYSAIHCCPTKTHNNHFNFNAPIIWK